VKYLQRHLLYIERDTEPLRWQKISKFFHRLLRFDSPARFTVAIEQDSRYLLAVFFLCVSRYQERVKIHFEKLILDDEDVS
jgi:hypothetical protein